MSEKVIENWFYTNNKIPHPTSVGWFAYKWVNSEPRPGNLEDELVAEFIETTNQPMWVGDNVEYQLRLVLRRAADAAVRAALDAEKPASGVVYETAEERAAKQTLAAKQALRELEAKRAGPFSNGIWTPPVAISDIKKDLIDAEDRGEGVVNLILGYAAVAIIERLEWQASQIERIADALEAKAVRP